MTQATLEHVNISVTDPQRSAKLMQDLFGWHIRWEGPAMAGGYTVHVGYDNGYLALYTNPDIAAADVQHPKGLPLNHIGVIVGNLDAVEAKVIAAGFEPFSHSDYGPSQSFYFFDRNGIEFEVVSYA